jgi:hypothetical protein
MICPYSKGIGPPWLFAPFHGDRILLDQFVEFLVAKGRSLDLSPGRGIGRVVTRPGRTQQELAVGSDGKEVEVPFGDYLTG